MLNLHVLNHFIILHPSDPLEKPPYTFFRTPETALPAPRPHPYLPSDPPCSGSSMCSLSVSPSGTTPPLLVSALSYMGVYSQISTYIFWLQMPHLNPIQEHKQMQTGIILQSNRPVLFKMSRSGKREKPSSSRRKDTRDVTSGLRDGLWIRS